MRPSLNYEFDVDYVVEHLDTKGMFLLRNLISKELVEALKLESKNLYKKNPRFVTNKRADDRSGSYRINIVPIHVHKYDGYDLISSIKRVIDHPRIRDLADTALRSKSGVSNYIYDYSTIESKKEKSGADLFPLHYDWRDYHQCIKLYIYLNDIDVEQGAIRYIPYSHHLVRYLWKNKRRELQQLWSEMDANKGQSPNSLESLLSAVSSEVETNYPNSETIKILKSVISDKEKSHNFAIAGNPGDVLVFDENGIHGGGPMISDHRHICRIHFVDRKYVNRRLPDQQSRAIRYLVSPLRRRIQSLLNLVE